MPNDRYKGKTVAAGGAAPQVEKTFKFEVKENLTTEEVVAKVLMAARDPDDDEEVKSKLETGSTVAAPAAAAPKASAEMS